MAIFLRDIRIAVRMLRKAPAFTFGAVLVLGLGIGATTAIFSLVDAALIRPLPFRDAGRLVRLFERTPQGRPIQVAFSNFTDWRDQSRSFAGMAGGMGAGLSSLTDTSGAAADPVVIQSVTPGFFEVLGIAPLAGRTFARNEADGAPMVILSERVWRNRFNANPSTVGGTVKLGGNPRTVIGVVPAGFELLSKADVWTPIPSTLTVPSRRVHYLDVVARLAPGVTIDQARGDLGIIAGNIARLSPDTNKDWGVAIDPLQRSIVSDDLRRTSLMLGAGVLFLLLMACANVANLLLARGLDRTRELAVRAAIGGSPARIVRQLLTESLLLAAMGGASGVLLAWAIVRAAPALIPPRTIPPGIVLALDWRLMAFALALTLVISLASGCAPAWQATRISLVDAIGAGMRSTAGRGGVRGALAIVQVAATLLLVAGAGLFVRTIVSLNHVDGGFEPDHLLTLSVSLPLNRYGIPDRWLRFYDGVVEETGQLPGVRAASYVCCDVPLDGFGLAQTFEVPGGPRYDPANLPIAHLQLAGPRYFETIGIAIRSGRAFDRADVATGAPVCIVNEEFARRYLPGRDPIGAVVNVTPLTLRPMPGVARTVVGVARQVKMRPGEPEPAVEIYLPFAQNPWFSGRLVVRAAAGDAALLEPAIKAMISRRDGDLAVPPARTMETIAAEATASPRFRAALVGAFAALAIVLAGVGLLSVLSYVVRQRAQEFGVRVALGAKPADLVRMVLATGATLTAIGVAAGLASATVLLRFLTSLLFGVKPLDPVTLASAAAIVAVLTIVASAAPALRALRTDPAVMLRQS